MEIDMQKIDGLLKDYQAAHGPIAVQSHENVNCTDCYNGGGCRGQCQGWCMTVCAAKRDRY